MFQTRPGEGQPDGVLIYSLLWVAGDLRSWWGHMFLHGRCHSSLKPAGQK